MRQCHRARVASLLLVLLVSCGRSGLWSAVAPDAGPAGCGDLICADDETCTSCPADCGTCAAGCGDGRCVAPESCVTCARDCGPCASGCGDGTCSQVEDCQNCPADCGACSGDCGDGTCAAGESCHSCPADCGACLSYCEDGYCDSDEDCATCPADCGVCPPGCGDGACEPLGGETCVNCPRDCACGTGTCEEVLTCAAGCSWDAACVAGCIELGCREAQAQAAAAVQCIVGNCAGQCQVLTSQGCVTCIALACGSEALACYSGVCGPQDCGDGTCQQEEDCVNCPGDCGACPNLCGDDTCQPQEDCRSCPDDCGLCCGNGMCEADEDCESCAEDCGQCPLLCGDGICEQVLGETCQNCKKDCTCGGDTCAEVLACFQSCQDILCPNDCLNAGCAPAQGAAHTLIECALSSCLLQCLNPSDPGCQDCLLTSCSGPIVACIASGC